MIDQMRRATLMAITLIVSSGLIPGLLWAQRLCCEGDSWLKWTPEHRNTYVSAFVQGYYIGHIHACGEGPKHWFGPTQPGLDNSPVNKCLDRKWDFTKGVDLSRDVTAFYKRYPENRILLIKEVLIELGKGRRIEDIHDDPPFPAYKGTRGHHAKGRAK